MRGARVVQAEFGDSNSDNLTINTWLRMEDKSYVAFSFIEAGGRK
jgi:hypothetical protein